LNSSPTFICRSTCATIDEVAAEVAKRLPVVIDTEGATVTYETKIVRLEDQWGKPWRASVDCTVYCRASVDAWYQARDAEGASRNAP
jgi:hypothetical protein